MNCQRFTDVVSELARGQMMDADLRKDALVHAEACETCAERLTHEQALTRALRALSVQLEEAQAPAELELVLRKTFRETHVPSSTVVTANSRRYWLAVAAAVLLLVAGVVAMRVRDSQSMRPDSQIATEKPEPAGPQESSSPEKVVSGTTGQDNQQVQPRRRYAASTRRKTQNRAPEAIATNHVREIATDFIPLSYSSGVSIQDGGQIVRVELPRSALVKFGLPVNVDRLNEKVKADVWLGVDGLAHAIRFVQ